jgi:hypothetical protein
MVSYDVRTGSGQSKRQTAKRLVAGLGVLSIALLLITAFQFRSQLSATFLSPSPIFTVAPKRTIPSATAPEPTRIPFTPTTAILSSFTEEFVSEEQWKAGWSSQLRNGDPRKEKNFKYAISNGELSVDLTHQYVWGYFLYDPSIVYSQVEMEVVVDGLRSIDTLGLVCQFSDAGWYEFDINGGGEYFVRFVDSMKADQDEGRFLIDNGSVRGFKYATETITENRIRVRCGGNYLSFSINDTELMKDFPTRFILEHGQVGLSVRSYENYPVQVVVKSIKVSEP